MYFEFQERPRQGATWSPTVDVCERADEIVIFVEMPGVSRSDVQLEARDFNQDTDRSEERQGALEGRLTEDPPAET